MTRIDADHTRINTDTIRENQRKNPHESALDSISVNQRVNQRKSAIFMPFKKITLDNGLRIILVPQEQSLAVTVLVLVEAGSKYETKEINGLSHFLEHMCFKGTEKRPRSIDIASELAGIGAISNAFTSLEYTGYFAKSDPRHLHTILDVISDVYLNPTFDPKEIDKERGVIIEERNMIIDTPMRYIGDLWLNLLYGDEPAGLDVIGTKENIQRLNRDDFIQYREKHYLSNSTVVVVAGKFDEEDAVHKIKESFSGVRDDRKTQKVKTIENQTKPEILLKSKETDQTHLILGVRAFDVFDERKYALEVLSDILGGGMSSRLFQKIRDGMGAAYYVFASDDLFSDHGYLAVQAGVPEAKIDSVIHAILHEMRKIVNESVSDKELARAKEHLVGTLMLGLETSSALAGFYGDQEIIEKKIAAPEEYEKKIRAVTTEEIQSVARDIFQNNKLNLAVIGPIKDKERFEKILTL